MLADRGHLFECGIPDAVHDVFRYFSYLVYTIKERISGDRNDPDLAIMLLLLGIVCRLSLL